MTSPNLSPQKSTKTAVEWVVDAVRPIAVVAGAGMLSVANLVSRINPQEYGEYTSGSAIDGFLSEE